MKTKRPPPEWFAVDAEIQKTKKRIKRLSEPLERLATHPRTPPPEAESARNKLAALQAKAADLRNPYGGESVPIPSTVEEMMALKEAVRRERAARRRKRPNPPEEVPSAVPNKTKSNGNADDITYSWPCIPENLKEIRTTKQQTAIIKALLRHFTNRRSQRILITVLEGEWEWMQPPDEIGRLKAEIAQLKAARGKGGRPPIGDRAMTGAERVARWRARKSDA
jgi:hypothetical protein